MTPHSCRTAAAGVALLLAATTLPNAWAQSSGSKNELAQKIVQLQQPVVENMARQLVEMPAAQILQQAGPVLQQKVAADKQESVGQEIQNDARRYVDETLPIVRDRAVKIAPDVLVPILESKLTEDELKQVLQTLQMLDSPAFRKYGALGQDMQRALSERLVTDTRASVEPKMKTLQDSVGKRLGVSPRASSAPAGSGAPPAPAKK